MNGHDRDSSSVVYRSQLTILVLEIKAVPASAHSLLITWLDILRFMDNFDGALIFEKLCIHFERYDFATSDCVSQSFSSISGTLTNSTTTNLQVAYPMTHFRTDEV